MSITLLAIIHFTLLFHGTALLILSLCSSKQNDDESDEEIRCDESDEEIRCSAGGSGSKSTEAKPSKQSARKVGPKDMKGSGGGSKQAPSKTRKPPSSTIKKLSKEKVKKRMSAESVKITPGGGEKEKLKTKRKELPKDKHSGAGLEPQKEKRASVRLEPKVATKQKGSKEGKPAKKHSAEKKEQTEAIKAKVRSMKGEAATPKSIHLSSAMLQKTQEFEKDKVAGGCAYYPDEGQDDTGDDAPSFKRYIDPPSGEPK